MTHLLLQLRTRVLLKSSCLSARQQMKCLTLRTSPHTHKTSLIVNNKLLHELLRGAWGVEHDILA